ncbi:hypothetical protein ACMYL5_23675, partial [Salmonella enterica subsp. enterica serovar Typhimurium]|uniref:hypothetical protein n=1 Tax=Salmonella enterica TaxID=28901 RepID=UPI0039ED6F9B
NDVRNELSEKLSKLESPITGESIANDVHFGNEIYNGEYVSKAPDLVVEQMDGVHIDGGVGRSHVFEGPSKWYAENYRTETDRS